MSGVGVTSRRSGGKVCSVRHYAINSQGERLQVTAQPPKQHCQHIQVGEEA